jgi:hypothetical protein
LQRLARDIGVWAAHDVIERERRPIHQILLALLRTGLRRVRQADGG